MKCRKCGSENAGIANFCAKCGASLSAGSILDQPNAGAGNLTGGFQSQLDATKASIDAEIARFTSTGFGTGRLGDGGGAKAPIHPMELLGLIMPLPDQILQSKNIALSSPFIHANAQYHARIEKTSFRYLPKDMTVNAFATDFAVPIGEEETLDPPAIAFLGGLAMVLRLASAALAAFMRPRSELRLLGGESSLLKAFQGIGNAILTGGGKIDPESMEAVFKETILPELDEDDDRFTGLAHSLSAAMEAAVIAHEAGHLSLGHTLGRRLNFDVSRNQEREADSFASSVLSSSPFREYLFLGQIFVTIIFSWIDYASRKSDPSTHPLGRERFFNAMTSNSAAAREAASQFGLTRERLIELLPADDAQSLNLRFLQVPDLLHP